MSSKLMFTKIIIKYQYETNFTNKKNTTIFCRAYLFMIISSKTQVVRRKKKLKKPNKIGL